MNFAEWRDTAFGLVLAAAAGLACSTTSVGTDGGPVIAGKLDAGAPCSDGGACQSGICLGGNCCAVACSYADPRSPQCSACDSSGACQYPAVECRAASCDPQSLIATAAAICDRGSCPAPQTATCSSSCQGTACGSGCLRDNDCAVGSHCLPPVDAGFLSQLTPGTCGPRSANGAGCLHGDECSSGICFNQVCCATSCAVDPGHPECAACDGRGACTYPAASCAAARCDATANSYVAAAVCQAGSCPSPVSASCGSFACGPSGCLSQCSADGECANGASCLQGACCPALGVGGHLRVDSVQGLDAPCCGTLGNRPCRTLEGAIAQLTAATAKAAQLRLPAPSQTTFDLSVDGGGGDWPVGASDSDPAAVLDLPFAATVHGPGVFVGGFSSESATYAGDPGNPMYLGIRQRDNTLTAPLIFQGGVLNLSNVVLMDGLLTEIGTGPTLAGAHATSEVHFGRDGQGNLGGTVQVGPLGQVFNGSRILPASTGVVLQTLNCAYVFPTVKFCTPPALVAQDHAAAGSTSAVVQIGALSPDSLGSLLGQTYNLDPGIWVGPGVSLTLTQAPILGNPLGQPPSSIGIFSEGDLHLANAIVQNQSGSAVVSAGGNMLIENSQLRDNGCAALSAVACQTSGAVGCTLEATAGGRIAVRNSSLEGNFIGAVVFAGELDLGTAGIDGGAAYPANRLACNTTAHLTAAAAATPGTACSGLPANSPGSDVWNQSANPVVADEVAWAIDPPSVWFCDSSLSAGSCQYPDGGPACPSDAGCKTPEVAVVSTNGPAPSSPLVSFTKPQSAPTASCQ